MGGPTKDGAIGLAHRLIGISRRRDILFGRGILSELQWDMLLRLLVEIGDRGLPERAMLVGNGVATAEAARQLDQLVEQGLVWRVAESDARQRVQLTSATRSRVIRALEGIGDLAEDMRNTIQTIVHAR